MTEDHVAHFTTIPGVPPMHIAVCTCTWESGLYTLKSRAWQAHGQHVIRELNAVRRDLRAAG